MKVLMGLVKAEGKMLTASAQRKNGRLRAGIRVTMN
jgi:hypothetical protein